MADTPRTWPALRLDRHAALSDDERERLLADIDGAGVIGLDEDAGGVSLYFQDAAARDALLAALSSSAWAAGGQLSACDVPDDGWAARSQADLPAVQVDAIVVSPPWDVARVRAGIASLPEGERPDVIEIEPSTGFGTGHHQSTRLCLRALQLLDVRGLDVLDVGTGSGVLAIAAVRRGAARALGVDPDQDAIDAARDSIRRNGAGSSVQLRQTGLDDPALRPAALVFANLTGALLRREADAITRLVAPGGRAILSGFTKDEAPWVAQAFAGCEVEQQLEEEGWVALVLRQGVSGGAVSQP